VRRRDVGSSEVPVSRSLPHRTAALGRVATGGTTRLPQGRGALRRPWLARRRQTGLERALYDYATYTCHCIQSSLIV
jgi:hypothetical protein